MVADRQRQHCSPSQLKGADESLREVRESDSVHRYSLLICIGHCDMRAESMFSEERTIEKSQHRSPQVFMLLFECNPSLSSLLSHTSSHIASGKRIQDQLLLPVEQEVDKELNEFGREARRVWLDLELPAQSQVRTVGFGVGYCQEVGRNSASVVSAELVGN